MARISRKSRPNEIPLDFSDATPHDVLKANRTRRRRAMNIGYARTSTWDQTAGLAAQQRDLKAAGAEKVFSEQASSVAQRTKLERVPFLLARRRRADGDQARPAGAQHDRAADHRGRPVQARHRAGGPVHGRRAAGHPKTRPASSC